MSVPLWGRPHPRPREGHNRTGRERKGEGRGGGWREGLKVHYWADLHLIAIYNQVIKPLEMGVKNGEADSP